MKTKPLIPRPEPQMLLPRHPNQARPEPLMLNPNPEASLEPPEGIQARPRGGTEHERRRWGRAWERAVFSSQQLELPGRRIHHSVAHRHREHRHDAFAEW